MNTPRLVSQLLPFLWVAWIAATAGLVVRVLRRHVWATPQGRKVFWLALFFSLIVFLSTLVLPYRIDSSGLLELSGGTEPWKGAAGEALLRVLGPVGTFSHKGVILVSRACVLPACLLALVLAAATHTSRPLEHQESPDRGLPSNAWLLLVSTAVLLLTPSYLFGVLGVFNFWFFGMLAAALLLAWDALANQPTWAVRLSLVSSIVLLGFARPETVVAGLGLAALLVGVAFRRRDWSLVCLAAAALLLLGVAAPSMLGYLDDRMRNQPLLMGSDTAGSASLGRLVWIALRRIALHTPLNLIALLLSLHALAVLAFLRAAQMVRQPKGDGPEWAALILVVTEILAQGIHAEGFVRYIKYGQLVVVPVWFLALRACYAQEPRRVRRWLGISLTTAAIVGCASVVLGSSGITRCSLPQGRTLGARLRDQVLLWETAPRWTTTLACADRAPNTVRVVIVGLEERVLPKGLTSQDPLSKPSCEPERWPVGQLIGRGGCSYVAVYPQDQEHWNAAFSESLQELLCRAWTYENYFGAPLPATHAILSYYRRETADQLKTIVASNPLCSWKVVEVGESAMLLERLVEARN